MISRKNQTSTHENKAQPNPLHRLVSSHTFRRAELHPTKAGKNGGAWVFTDVGATTEFGEPGRNINTAHALLISRGGSRARMLIQEEKLR